MLTSVAWFLAGLAALVLGADVIVRGGGAVASRLRISPMLVGLTVVAIGTSMPELAVGVVAAAEGSGALAVGNITGTNIVNLLLVLGLSALILPLAIEIRTLRFELPVMAIAALLLWALAAYGVLSRLDGLILLVAAIVYTAVLIRTARRESRSFATEPAAADVSEVAADSEPAKERHTVVHIALMLGGIAVVVLGAKWLVDAAIGIARGFGVSDAFIGLTVVAIGTSAPELVTTIVSTLRNERDIAIGNLLGSSIYNILLVLGITCLIPTHGLALPPSMVRIDIPIMAAVVLVCFPIFVSGRRVHRAEGAAMVVAYLAFLALVLATQM